MIRSALAAVALAALMGAGGPAGPPYDVVVGFGGAYQTGAWTPVVVSLPADAAAAAGIRSGDTIHLSAEDPDGQFVRSPPVRCAEGPDGGIAARACVRFGRPSGRLRIEHVPAGQGGRRPAAVCDHRLPPPIPSTESVILVLGDLQGTGRVAQLVAREDGTKPRIVPLVDGGATAAGALARDYDGADAIVVCGRSLPRFGADVIAGIDRWVRQGGRLVFIAGASAAGLEAPAAAWLPGAFTKVVPLRRLDALETAARAGRLPRRAAAGVQVPVFDPIVADAVTDVSDGEASAGMPLLVRRAHGLGTIAWLGIDIDADPFRDWPGAENLVAEMLEGRTAAGETGGAPQSRGRVPDLAGQLRVALERSAPGAESPPPLPIPFEVVAALGLLAVFCFYPLDWWLASTAADRPRLAWLSLPVLVAACTGLIWAAGGRLRPAAGGLRFAAEIVDIDAAHAAVRGTAWSGIHDSRNAVFSVTADVSPAVARPGADVAISWLGDAGGGFGGMDAAMPHPSLATADYAYGDSLATLDGVPIAAASSRLFEAEWFAEAEPTPIAESTLGTAAQGTLVGTVAHHLPFALDACRLLHAGWLYDVGRLEPGQRYDTQAGRGPRSLAAALTRRSGVKERDVAVRWDSAETDVDRILEIAGFHAAAGGGYTGLAGGRLARLDLSPLLQLNRAVLVGVADRGQTTWRFPDGRATGRGVYRIVIPLTPNAAPPAPATAP